MAKRKVTAVERDRLVEGAQRAAAQPLTENGVRQHVDDMFRAAGWAVQDISQVNLYAADGVAVREVSTAAGRADYLLWVDRKLVGVIEAKRQGTILLHNAHRPHRGRLTAARVRRGFRNIRAKTTLPISVPKPGKPGPGRPLGSKNRRPAPHHDVGKTIKRETTLAARLGQAG
jgi:hypothetical protein